MSEVSGVLKLVRCPGSSYIWSQGQVLILSRDTVPE